MKNLKALFQNSVVTGTFHRIELIAKSLFPKQVDTLYRIHHYQTSDAPFRPCHFRELFVRHNGDIYPCCRIWYEESLKIGTIYDPPELLQQQLRKLDHHYCRCKRYRLRPAQEHEEPQFDFLHLELSLTCQANCAMCCVEAPSWKGRFEHYDALHNLIRFCRPKRIEVQGGEVLIQKKSLEWIREMKHNYPDISFSIVTNGHVELDMLPVVEELFDTVTVSIIGFQPETYRKIMGIEFEKTLRFIEELIQRKHVIVAPYYLLTPSNLHETDLFLRWAVNMLPERIRLADAYLEDYIKIYTQYNYWEKMFSRTSKTMKTILSDHRAALLEHGVRLEIDSRVQKFFELHDEFIQQHGFERIIYCEEL